MKTEIYQIKHTFHDSQSMIMEEIKDCLHRVGVNSFEVTIKCHTEFRSIGTGIQFAGIIKRIAPDQHEMIIRTQHEPFAMDLGHEINRCIEQKKLQIINLYHLGVFRDFKISHWPELIIDVHFAGVQKDTKNKIYKCTVHTDKLVDKFTGTFEQIFAFMDGLNPEHYKRQKFATFDHDTLIMN